MEETLVYRTPTFVIAGVVFVLMLVLTAVFYRYGERRARTLDVERADVAPVDGAVAALLALLLALSFSLASERFVARQALVVKEANAIGTAFLRCALLEPEDRRFCEGALRAYVDLRIAYFEEYRDTARYKAIIDESERVQRAVFDRVTEAVHREKNYPALGLLVQALNEMIDVHGERVASFRITVPQPITVLLLCLSLAWSCVLGYALGLKGRRRTGAVVAFSVLVTLVAAATLDLDRPRRGLITLRAGQESLLELQRAIKAR